MQPNEFKAWFGGYIENIDGEPNKKQWKRIKARIKEIDGVAITPTIIRDYWRPYWHIDQPLRYNDLTPYCTVSERASSDNLVFNATAEMATLGMADAQADAA